MNQDRNGGPAFPVPGFPNDDNFNGMSLLDHFAGLAMVALLARPDAADIENDMLAAQAYHMARSMLTVRAMPAVRVVPV